MKVNAFDLITKPTIGSSRNLIIVSASVYSVKRYGLNADSWNVFGREIPPEVFTEITTAVMVFLLLTHLVHWWHDYTAYTKWFKINEVSKGSLYGVGAVKNTESPLKALERRLTQLEESNSTANEIVLDLGKIDISAIKDIQGDRDVAKDLETLRTTVSTNKDALLTINLNVSDIKELLDGLGPSFNKIKWSSRAVVFVWYLFVPLLAFMIAILSYNMP